MRRKVSIVGADGVGSTTALWIASKELADVVLIDEAEGPAQGKAQDLLQAMPIGRTDVHVTGSSHYEASANSDIVVITAGVPRKSGISRHDLLRTNYKTISEVVKKVVAQSPECILIVVSSPLDVMAQAAYRQSGFNRERVLGMAGVLDSARMRSFIATELNVSVDNVSAFVLGGHGSAMLPLIRYATVAGIPITELLSPERIEAIVQRTREGDTEIVNHLKSGSASYAPSAATAEMVEAILKDKKKILPCAACLQGEYGIDGYFIGIPCKLGSNGLEEIIEIKLTAEENAALQQSADSVRDLCSVIGL
jgi:malate dehydrogenase